MMDRRWVSEVAHHDGMDRDEFIRAAIEYAIQHTNGVSTGFGSARADSEMDRASPAELPEDPVDDALVEHLIRRHRGALERLAR